MSEPIASAIFWGQQQIDPISDSAKLDAELLLAHCLQKTRSYLYSWPEKTLDEPVWKDFQQLVSLRVKPTPVAYLLAQREFYSLNFKTSPAVLIPRPETELLVDTCLQLCHQKDRPHILEMGTGSGIISIVLLRERPDSEILTTDISPDCLRMAEANARIHSVSLNCIESGWYQNVPGQSEFDLIVSNPPYIAENDPCLKQGDLPAEPILALTPGKTGLEAIEQIIAGATEFLKPGGYLCLEHGHDQATMVAELLRATGFVNIRNKLDYDQLPRVSLGQLP